MEPDPIIAQGPSSIVSGKMLMQCSICNSFHDQLHVSCCSSVAHLTLICSSSDAHSRFIWHTRGSSDHLLQLFLRVCILSDAHLQTIKRLFLSSPDDNGFRRRSLIPEQVHFSIRAAMLQALSKFISAREQPSSSVEQLHLSIRAAQS